MGIQIALVRIDDWQGLYINEKLIRQDHTVSAAVFASYCLHQVLKGFDQYQADMSTEDFPEDLRDVLLDTGKTIGQTWEES